MSPEKKYFIKDGKVPPEIYEDYPRTNRVGWCGECGQISFVDQEGGPFQSIPKTCGDPEQARRCKEFGVAARRERKKREAEYARERAKREKDPKYRREMAEIAELFAHLDARHDKQKRSKDTDL